MKKILAYSAMKIKAKPPAPYSILNPDTNSDSPSAKSKGVRLVSAKQEINHIPTKGKKMINFNQKKFSRIPKNQERDFIRLRKKRKIKARLTS